MYIALKLIERLHTSFLPPHLPGMLYKKKSFRALLGVDGAWSPGGDTVRQGPGQLERGQERVTYKQEQRKDNMRRIQRRGETPGEVVLGTRDWKMAPQQLIQAQYSNRVATESQTSLHRSSLWPRGRQAGRWRSEEVGFAWDERLPPKEGRKPNTSVKEFLA